MKYRIDLIQVTKCPDSGRCIVGIVPFLKAHPGLEEVRLPKAFDTELDRLCALQYSDEVADRIRTVIALGYEKGQTPDVAHYAVHSTVRSRFNRTERAQAALHARFKQHVLPDQRRLIRARPTIISEYELNTNREDLLAKQEAGLLEVKTLDGRLVDLKTLEVMPAAPEPTAPHPIMDSVANDTPTGIPFAKFQGDKVLNKDEIGQVVEGMAGVEGELYVGADGTVTVLPEGASAPEPEIPHDDIQEVVAESVDEEELDDLPPGIPEPPPPPGGVPRQKHKKNKR